MAPRNLTRTRLSGAAFLVAAIASSQAQGQTSVQTETSPHPAPAIPDVEKPPLGLFPAPPDDALMDPRMVRSWGAAPVRSFVSTTVDVGFVYFRPRVALGYGKPFTSWIGVEANPIVTSEELAVYGGVRAELPYVDFRAGPRFFRAFDHTYLDDQPSFTRLELETANGRQATATTYEAELDLSVPIGPGNIVGRGSVSYVTGVPAGQDVFEETLHVIVRPPWVWRGRLGYAFRFGTYGQHSIGLIAEVLDVPMREDAVTVRAGPLLRFVLSRRVELRGSFVIPVKSPDSIGIVGGDFAELGVRYRWASE
jgi:hypothetical protein